MHFPTCGAAAGPPARGAELTDGGRRGPVRLVRVGERARPGHLAGRRRGAALAEVVVAALVLGVGLLATAGAVAGATRDVGRARALDAATELLVERVGEWRRAPCAAVMGERVVGALRERWRVEVVAGLGVLADTVTSAAGGPVPRVGVVAAAGCGP